MLSTVKDILDLSSTTSIDEECSKVHVVAKFGIDGSGQHKFRQQNLKATSHEESIKAQSNYVCAVWCPLQVQVKNNLF